MFSAIDIAVLVISVVCGIGAVVTALLAYGHRAATELEGQREAAIEQLQEWRDARFVVMSEEDFQWTAKVEEHDPQQLYNLVRAIQRIVDREDSSPGDTIMLEVKVEYEEEPVSAAKPGPSKGHLELVATFA